MENRICRRSLAVYLALWAFFVAAFWLRLDACGLLYGLAAFYIVLPLGMFLALFRSAQMTIVTGRALFAGHISEQEAAE